jgi:ABC-type Fe3+ transport system substrate-binding protein
MADRRFWRGGLLAALVALTALACAPAAGQPASRADAPAASVPAGGPAASAPAGAQPAAPPAAPLQAVIDAARAEGELRLVWSEGSMGGSDGMRRLADGLNKAYGLNLSLQWTPGPPFAELAAKLIQEHQAGRPATSDVFLGAEQTIAALLEADALLPVDWASWAPHVQDARLIAPDGVAVELDSRVPGITYHSDRVRGDAVPVTLEDALKPQYKGRIASTPYATTFDRLVSPELWGEQRTVEFVTKLAGQIGGLMRCGENDRLLSGEFDMLVVACGGYEAYRMQAKGAPLDHAVPADAAIIGHLHLAVPRNAAHPNAAKLFANYMLSREGQDLLYELEHVDHHLLPGSKSAWAIEGPQAKGIQFTEIDVAFIQRNNQREMSRLRSELQRILQASAR